MTPARASLPCAHYFASLPLQSQRKNFNVDDDDDALLASLYDLNGEDEKAAAKERARVLVENVPVHCDFAT